MKIETFFYDFQHIKRCFKPTDTWYENEHRELMQTDPNVANKSSIYRGAGTLGGYQPKNITEV